MFDHFPKESKCPVCGTSDDKPCVLVPIHGTQDGNNVEAQPVHADCILNGATIYESPPVIACPAIPMWRAARND